LGEDQWGVYTNEVPEASSVETTGGIKITNEEAFKGRDYEKWDLTYEKVGTDNKYFLNINGTKMEMGYNEVTKKLNVADTSMQEELKGLQIDLSGYVKPSKATIDSDSIGSSLKIDVLDDTGYLDNTDLNWKVVYLDNGADVPGYYIQDGAGSKERIPGNGEFEFPKNSSQAIKFNVSGFQSMTKPDSTIATLEEIEAYASYVSYTGTSANMISEQAGVINIALRIT